jgi:hypothetical protein
MRENSERLMYVKKKVLFSLILSLLISSTAWASSLNGDYKGNPIVKVMSNGKQLQSDEVPAMIYDGHTVVPISLLRQIGASVEWNQETYSVDVKIPQPQDNNSVKIAYDVDMYRYIYFINEQSALVSQIMFMINISSNSQNDKNKVIEQVNRLRNDVNDDWVKGFSTMQVYSGDVNQMTEIKVCLDNIKQYLLKFDTTSAQSEWSLMKRDINNLYNKYDQIVQKDNEDVFNKAISNLNAQQK